MRIGEQDISFKSAFLQSSNLARLFLFTSLHPWRVQRRALFGIVGLRLVRGGSEVVIDDYFCGWCMLLILLRLPGKSPNEAES